MDSKRIAAATAIATALAVPAEGLRQYAYYDPPGILAQTLLRARNTLWKSVTRFYSRT